MTRTQARSTLCRKPLTSTSSCTEWEPIYRSWNACEDPQAKLVLCPCLESEFGRVIELAVPVGVTGATPDGDVYLHTLACPPMTAALLHDQTGQPHMENAVERFPADRAVCGRESVTAGVRACMRVPRKRHGVSLLGSAANMQYCTHVGLGQPAEPPMQATKRVKKALGTCRALSDLLAINMTMSALRRRGC